MDRKHVEALFVLAGIEVRSFHELPNNYWPDAPDYAEVRRNSPWWLVSTARGLIKIGWRKRVISIDYADIGLNQILTEDNTTKAETMVHAWSYAKAVEYLTELRLLTAIAAAEGSR